MKTSFKRLVLGAVAVVSVTVVSAFTAVGVLSDLEAANERAVRNGTRLAALGAPLVLGALVIDDLATAEQALRAMNADRAFDRVALLAPEGAESVLDASPDHPGRAVAPAWFRRLLAVDMPELRVPVEAGGVTYAVLALEPAAAALTDEAWLRVRNAFLETVALLAVLMLALERALARGLRPIRELAAAATRFGHGDYAVRMRPAAIAEADRVAHAFNGMADSLERALAALRAKEAANRRLAAVVEQTDEAILTIDSDHRIETWNDGAARLSGRPAAEVIGQPLSALLPGTSVEERAERFAQLIAASPAAPFETVIDRGGGDKRHVAAAATPLVDEGGTGLGWVIVVRDVTPRKRAEMRLAQAMREAEFANRSKSEFLANMSHELRTPLNAIIGFSSVMRDEMFGPLGQGKYRGYANDIHEAGSHLLAIINDLLDVSAIEAEKLELTETTFPLRRPLDSAVRLVASRLEACKVELRRALADDLPSLRGDERRLKQVLLNLLTNAIKFTPAGGRVLVSAQVDGNGDLELVVSDTGIGMDARGIAKALERFGQVDGGLDRRREGTGLGLPLTMGLVELHGGSLRIDSEPGTGTTVTIILPAERLVYEERPALRLVQAG